MVGRAYDLLRNPQGAIRLTFEKALADAGGNPASFGKKDWGVKDLFHHFLYEEGGISKVPMMTADIMHLIQPNSLVRFRGMVQDMLDNEFYVGVFKDGCTWKTNKFMDGMASSTAASSDMQIWERRLLYCVPVPGENSWVKEASPNCIPLSLSSVQTSSQREKRQRESSPDEMNFTVSTMEAGENSSSSKKLCTNGDVPRLQEIDQHDPPAVVPSFDGKGLSCLVKIYHEEADLKLNDVLEFIGIFTFDPEPLLLIDEHDDSADFMNDVPYQLPPSKVPRLHCITSKRLNIQDVPSCPYDQAAHLGFIRESLLARLTFVLGGDRLSATFALLHLLSQVLCRIDCVTVGKFSLNLTGFNSESADIFGPKLQNAIQELLPYSLSMKLTVEYLNEASFAPMKDYDTNRLVTGDLQFAQGTHLLVDETKLRSGSLTSAGIKNVQLLQELLQAQKVCYDFKYHKLEMDTDVQVLVISEAKSNIVPCDIVLPFQPTEASGSLSGSPPELQAWRWYLSTLRSFQNKIAPELEKIIQHEMVSARQADRSLGPDDFSRWMTMARLVSISFGSSHMLAEHWQQAREMDGLRNERLAVKR